MIVTRRLFGALLVCSALLQTTTGSAQTAAAVDIGVVAGGNTNDVQLSYGVACELLRNDRVAAGVELLYMRDFFEFEPDDPISDALTYSSVTAVVATGRAYLLHARPRLAPYAIVGAGWLRASVTEAASDHPGYVIGVGTDLIASRRVAVSFEGRRFATFGSSPSSPFR